MRGATPQLVLSLILVVSIVAQLWSFERYRRRLKELEDRNRVLDETAEIAVMLTNRDVDAVVTVTFPRRVTPDDSMTAVVGLAVNTEIRTEEITEAERKAYFRMARIVLNDV